MQAASPVRGALTANNQPLNQVFAWPRDAAGNPLPLGQFPTVPGIPASMYVWLQTHPESDPGGLLRAQGVGGPLPVSGAVPVGMVLDPRTVHDALFNPRRSAAYERELEAHFLTAYADLVDDGDPDATNKNQLFFDRMDQFKSSNQPFSQVQVVHVLEDKLTLTRRLRDLPWHVSVNSLLTANARYTVSEGRMTLGDYGNHRGDASAAGWSAATGGMTPNTFFTSSNDVATLADDGLPWSSIYRTRELEFGLGALFDADLPGGVNLLAGARYDLSRASNIDFAGRFNINTGTSADPGAVMTQDDRADRADGGSSWSVSLSKMLPGGLRPYVTLARSSILLDGNNNSLTNVVIRLGQVGSAALSEAGVKGMWLDGAVSFTGAVYRQGRVDTDATDDPNLLNAYATSTTSHGWQVELRVAPSHRSLLGLYALRQATHYDPNVGATVQIDARALGFRDVLDASGRVVYPAEAFLYGGRARIMLPDGMPQFSRKQGIPELQMGLFASHEMRRGWGYSLRGNYLSSTCSGRLCLVRLPASLVFDAGVFARVAGMEVKLDVFNLTDRHYFRARTGDTLGDVIAQAMPGRRWQVTLRHRF
jgi:iron complex outermembrane recepter protein